MKKEDKENKKVYLLQIMRNITYYYNHILRKIHHAIANRVFLTDKYSFQYLPPYSPTMNPVELIFANIRKKI